ncbi:MAG: efflux transporter outer membrane subunit [Legionellales bacterium]|nr:efflux transporter outer membrane subunit [Legionellales bacterium]
MMILSLRIKMSLAITLLSLAGCAVGPDYVKPVTPVPAQYKEVGKTKWVLADPQDNMDRGQWWLIFNDPKLNSLENQLNLANQNIVNAEANYQQSRALVDEARAAFYPTLSGSLGVNRQKGGGGGSNSASSASSALSSSSSSTSSSGSGSGSGSGGGFSSSGSIFTISSVFLDASWEPDIWGLVRRTVEASVDTAQANAALLASTRLSQQATLAQTYFQLRNLDADQKLLDDTVIAYKKSLELTLNRYRAGVDSRVDVVQAQTQLESAESSAINNHISRAQFEHAIAVLVGQLPENFSLPPNPLTQTPPPIPLVIPSLLLERRPDVAQAERMMAEANAQIGIAIAAYFPTLTLTATGGLQNTSLSQLISASSETWGEGAQLTDLIFDGGLRSATVRAARAGYDANVATYRETVLSAFQGVEDNLAALRYLKQQAVVQAQAVTSADLALKLVLNQYKSGTTDYLSVIVQQATAFSANKIAIDITGQQMVAAVGLIKNLGGGWNAASLK